MPNQILDSIDCRSRIIFYPSSCLYSNEFQDSPYDVVILNSNSFRYKERRGKVYCLNYDNNELLGLFLAKGIQISSMLIIRDGCEEGGNYECIAREGFFGRLMPIMTRRFEYFSDHSSYPFDVPADFDEFASPNYLKSFIRMSSPLGKIRSFHVATTPTIEKDFILGQIRVKIVRDSIWQHVYQSDLVIIKESGNSTRRAIPKFLSGLMPDWDLTGKFEFATQAKTSVQYLLQKADDHRLTRLSLMPIANGSYQKIANEIQHWNKDYPKEIYFYHLNANDFHYLKFL